MRRDVEQVSWWGVDREHVDPGEGEIDERPGLETDLAHSPCEPGKAGGLGRPGVGERPAAQQLGQRDGAEREGDEGEERAEVARGGPDEEVRTCERVGDRDR
jgi:hypothetical protein